jgi:GntR family transcriptional regulator, transcriptional repressor for pyruvate dehydrogenase complex
VAVTDEAIYRIKQMIVSGQLRAGERLPREADLAERLGLSRSSLREAVKALSVIRILDVRQGDGTYVTRLEPRQLLEALSFVVDFHQDDTVLQVLEVRGILEPAATAIAAARADEGTIAGLYDVCRRAESAGPEELAVLDRDFHRLVAEAAGNTYLARLLDSLTGSTVLLRFWTAMSDGHRVPAVLAEHRAIVEALNTRQAEVARAWATVHVAGVESWLRPGAMAASLRNAPGPGPARSPGAMVAVSAK